VKVTPNILKRHRDEERGWPDYLFGGHVRTSTLVLIVVFLGLWWLYSAYRPDEPGHGGPPATQVVPPGFVPDPNYTWVPRSKLQQPPPSTVTVTSTPTTTVPPPSSPPVTTTTPPPPFVLPTPPCLLPPPFCPPSASPNPSPPQQPLPGPGPSPTSAPPAS
jgi:hypothetical protein